MNAKPGTIPSMPRHWTITRLKYATDKIGSGKTPSGGASAYVREGVPLIRSQNVRFEGLTLDDVVFIDELTDASMTASRVAPNDVLLNITGASLGRCCVVPAQLQRANVNQHVCILRPKRNVIEPRYLNAFLASQFGQRQIFEGEEGVSREGLNFEEIGNFVLPLPSLAQQRAIADSVDSESARIEQLITAKQKWLDLLIEKRRTLITEAVTCGIGTGVPSRDSGRSYLGRVPRHWKIARLKYATPDIIVGIVVTPAKYYQHTGVPCLRSLNVHETGIDDRDLVYISPEAHEELAKSRLCQGDLVVVRTGQPGTTAVVDSRFDGANCIDLIVIRRSEQFEPEFLSHFLNSDAARFQFAEGSGGAIQQHFNVETARDLTVVVPPRDEQREIMAYLGKVASGLDALVRVVERTIDLLRQRRAALIAAAVTGQIEGVGNFHAHPTTNSQELSSVR